MRRIFILAATVPVMAGCAIHHAEAGPAPTAAWLTAVWSQDATACGGDPGSLRFLPDGTYAIGDEIGRWQLNGDVLSIGQTGQVDGSGAAEPVSGEPVSLRVARLPGDRLHVTWPSGERYLYARCG